MSGFNTCALSVTRSPALLGFGVPDATTVVVNVPCSTSRGTADAVVSPEPSAPSTALPQHIAVPFASLAQLWSSPTVTAVADAGNGTTAGVTAESGALGPSWRASFVPQQ